VQFLAHPVYIGNRWNGTSRLQWSRFSIIDTWRALSVSRDARVFTEAHAMHTDRLSTSYTWSCMLPVCTARQW